MMNKELFQKFSVEHKSSLPFSLHYDWWNEVVQDHWDVAVISNENQVFGIMPYFIRKKGPWTMLTNPHFTPYCGPFLSYPEGQKKARKIAYEHECYEHLIEQLPLFSEYSQNFHLAFKNTLSFKWQGFEDSNRYTYILDLSQSEETLWSNLRENNRRQIKKADKSLQIKASSDAKSLQQMLAASFENKIELSYFERIIQYVEKHQNGCYWHASEGNDTHAALLMIWDSDTAYYLIGGSGKAFKNSGAMSLLLWKGILKTKEAGLKYFNFEGSSIPSIEKYLRGFGGELMSFVRITKNNSASLQVARKIKG